MVDLSLKQNPPHGWFHSSNIDLMLPHVKDANIILELGSWMGLSATWFMKNSNAKLYCVDYWEIPELYYRDVVGGAGPIPPIFDIFLANMDEYKDRLFALKMSTQEGIKKIKSLDISPDIIFVDAGHDYEDVYNDIEQCILSFPNAKVFGDDWQWYDDKNNDRTVKRAVEDICKKYNKTYVEREIGWQLV